MPIQLIVVFMDDVDAHVSKNFYEFNNKQRFTFERIVIITCKVDPIVQSTFSAFWRLRRIGIGIFAIMISDM